MPRAWSWSVAITRPPASGCVAAHSLEPGHAPGGAPSGSHSPSIDSAVRSRWLERAWSSASSNDAAWSEPSGAVHSMCAVGAREVHGPHHTAVGQRLAVAVLVVGRRPRRARSSRTGWPGCRCGTACPRWPGDGRPARTPAGPTRPTPGRRRRGGSRRRPRTRRWPRRRQHPGARRHLLVGGDDAVHVAREAGPRRPRRVEVEGEGAAAWAHCTFRWAVGATDHEAMARRSASTWRAAVSANVVLPAPGVATVRKSPAPPARTSRGRPSARAGAGSSGPSGGRR